MTAESNVRAERIDNAVGAAAELIEVLASEGPLNGHQARVIMIAAAKAAVDNVEEFEVRDSAKRVMADLEIRRGK